MIIEIIWTHTTHNCKNLVSTQVWRVAATATTATTATCIFGFRIGLSLGYGLEFIPCALALERGTLHLLAIGSRVTSRIILSIKVKVLGGGFDLWLGDNISILSMVKQAHLFFNRLWAHTIFRQSNCWNIDWEDFLSYSCSCSQNFVATMKP
jgi:hypothetical protein